MSIEYETFIKNSRIITEEEVKRKITECEEILKKSIVSDEEKEFQEGRKHVWERILVHVVMGRMVLTDNEEHVLLIDEHGIPVTAM